MSEGLKLLTSIIENGSTTTFRLIDRGLMADANEETFFDWVHAHFRRHGEFPTVQTAEEEMDFRLPDTPEAVDYYLEKVHDRALFTGVQPIFNELRQHLIAADSELIREAVHDLNSAVRQNDHTSELQSIAEVADDVMSGYEYAKTQYGMSGVTTGFNYMDEQTGGYQNSDLIMWVARPGVGKTHLLIHQARAAFAAGKSVLMVSMEMSLQQIGNRWFAQEANVDPDLVRKGRLSYFVDQRFRDTVMSVEQSNRFHLYAGNMKKKIEDLDILIQELAPDIVYIDGMYLMSPRSDRKRGTPSRFERAAYLVDDLKEMTITRDRPIVATTQFGRGAEKGGKKGSLETIGYTDAIGTHSSLVMSIKLGDPDMQPIRDEYGNELGRKPVFKHREIEILKGREGETGKFGINFGLAPTDFSQTALANIRGNSTEGEEGGNRNLDYMEE